MRVHFERQHNGQRIRKENIKEVLVKKSELMRGRYCGTISDTSDSSVSDEIDSESSTDDNLPIEVLKARLNQPLQENSKFIRIINVLHNYSN